MTPKEKAMKYLKYRGDNTDSIFCGCDVEKAIDIVLEEQHHQIFQPEFLKLERELREILKEEEQARWDWLEKEVDKRILHLDANADFHELIKEARTK